MSFPPPAQANFGKPSLLDFVHHLNWHSGDGAEITPRFKDGDWDYIIQTTKQGGPIEGSAYKREYGEALINLICAEAGIQAVGQGSFQCERHAVRKSNLVAKMIPPLNGNATWEVTVTRERPDAPRALVLRVIDSEG